MRLSRPPSQSLQTSGQAGTHRQTGPRRSLTRARARCRSRRRSRPAIRRACEDFGCQIGGMLTDPCPSPRKHLSSVSVIDLLERIGAARSQEFRVRHPSELASHKLYLTAQLKT
jgi:hypothetical protein